MYSLQDVCGHGNSAGTETRNRKGRAKRRSGLSRLAQARLAETLRRVAPSEPWVDAQFIDVVEIDERGERVVRPAEPGQPWCVARRAALLPRPTRLRTASASTTQTTATGDRRPRHRLSRRCNTATCGWWKPSCRRNPYRRFKQKYVGKWARRRPFGDNRQKPRRRNTIKPRDRSFLLESPVQTRYVHFGTLELLRVFVGPVHFLMPSLISLRPAMALRAVRPFVWRSSESDAISH